MGDRHFAKAKVSLELTKSCVEVKRDGVAACMYEQVIYTVTQALVAALLAIKGGYHVFQKKLPTCGLKIHGLSVTCWHVGTRHNGSLFYNWYTLRRRCY